MNWNAIVRDEFTRLGVIASVACLIPARRAARLDALEALRR